MRILQLDITIQDAIIAIRSQDARVRIRQDLATFRTEIQPARMRVLKKLPTFHVDRSASDAQLGSQSVMALLQSCARQAREDSMQGIARIAREGDRLMRIYDRHQTVAAVVASRAAETSTINVADLPKPVIEWEKGQMDVEWERPEVRNEWNTTDPVRFEVEPGSIEIQVVQPASVEIQAIPVGDDLQVKTEGPIQWIV
ncbi:MAG: hypothetical protein KBA30_10305 [Clostridia bacterium]|nr:hypothetical protein [Clostridia bacterium]